MNCERICEVDVSGNEPDTASLNGAFISSQEFIFKLKEQK